MKNNKKWHLFLLISLMILVLTACGTNPIDANSTGLWDRYIIYNFSRMITWLSGILNHNYGLGIIAFTFIVRVILIPLTFYQTKGTDKMQAMQPELKALQAKYASKDPETKEKLQEETAKLNEKYEYNPWTGCLPMLIQFPILIALYQAISRTEILQSGHFLWMEMGQSDPYFILPVLAGLLTWYSTRLTMIGSPTSNSQMAIMQWTMPAMILFMGITLPSAIALYWVASTGFTIVQTLIMNNPYKKRKVIEQNEQQELEKIHRLEKARRNPRGKKRK